MALNLSGRFVHAAQYAALMLQVTDHLFPGQKFFALSLDQRRILDSETRALLTQARWVVDSKAFAETFATLQTGGELAPAGTVLGDPPPAPERPGHYT